MVMAEVISDMKVVGADEWVLNLKLQTLLLHLILSCKWSEGQPNMHITLPFVVVPG